MNLLLLGEIKTRILSDPRHFDMAGYFHTAGWGCGTAACIAGWALAIKGGFAPVLAGNDRWELMLERDEFWDAAELLQLTQQEARRLFYLTVHALPGESWPHRFNTPYHEAWTARNYPEMARIACARIDHFIATNGAE